MTLNATSNTHNKKKKKKRVYDLFKRHDSAVSAQFHTDNLLEHTTGHTRFVKLFHIETRMLLAGGPQLEARGSWRG